MAMDTHRSRALLIWFAAAVVAAGLLTLLVEANPAWTADRSFEPAPNSPFPVGSTPTTVTNADFNGDGKMDLAAQNSGSNTVSVRLGNGDGTFQAKPDVAVGSTPTAVIGADLNDDGKSDLAVSNQLSNSVTVRLGNGDGTFPVRQDFPAGSGPTSVISADFNRDGYVDLAVANYPSNRVSVLLGQDADGDGKADGTFVSAGNFSVDLPCGGFCIPATAGPNQVIVGNFNGDSSVDLATANIGSCGFFCTPGGVSVLLGNGNGTFQNAKLATSGAPIYSIDANGSGDIFAANYNGNAVAVLRSNGNGTFSSGGSLPVGTHPSAVASEDLDGNGVEDLAVSNFDSDNVSVLWDNGSGGFQTALNFAAGDGPAFVIGARVNADEFADLAVANQNSNNVSVLLNTESQPPPPETTITKGPPDPDNKTSATFEFSSSEPGSTFQCALDVNAPSTYSPCTSPEAVPEEGLLSEGSHIFYVKATGTAGNNTDPTPARYEWRVDITAPAAPEISSPSEGSRVGSSFTVSGTAEPNSTVQLSEGTASKGSATVSSTGNWSILLSGITEGSHTYKAKATDEAGNSSAESNPRTVTVDTTTPDAPVITSPAEGARLKVSSLTIAGTAEANSTVEVFEATASGDTSKGTTQVDASGAWTKTISGVSDGSHTYKANAKDAAEYTSGFSNSRTVTVDTVKPEVSSTTPPTPLAGSTNVGRGTNLTATFSEKMRPTSINTSTFKLFKVNSDGTQTQITDVVVSLSSADGLKATLNPFGAKTTLLARNTKYKGVVTTGAKDLAGNSLAQQKSWTFTTKP